MFEGRYARDSMVLAESPRGVIHLDRNSERIPAGVPTIGKGGGSADNLNVARAWAFELLQKPILFFGTLLMLISLLYKKGLVALSQCQPRWNSDHPFLAALVIPTGLRASDDSRSKAPLSGPMAGPVLIVGAHPDDIELGAAGCALRLCDEGAKVHGMILTRGEKGSKAPVGTREREAQESANVLRLESLGVLDFPDTCLRQHIPAIRDAIDARISEIGARVVVTHGPQETHGDHFAVFEAAKEASRKCSLLCFESISAPKEFVPNLFIDITPYLSGKLRAISLHKTQHRKFYMNGELVKGRAAHRGLQAGVHYAEAFWIYRWIQ